MVDEFQNVNLTRNHWDESSFKEYRELLENIKGNLDLKIEYINNNENVKLQGISKVNQYIFKLKEFGFIDKEYEKLIENHREVIHFLENEIILKKNSYNAYNSILQSIVLKLDAVIDAVSMTIKNQEKNSISIKLPPFTDLKSVGNFIEDVDKIFKSVLPDKKPSEIKLSTFDTGSNWIEIVVNSAESVVIIGEFIKITTELAKSIMSFRGTTKKLECSTTVEDEAKQIVLQSMKNLEVEQSKISVEKFLENGTLNKEDLTNINEYRNELSKQILIMADYLIKGAEVKPALNAPKEQKEEFPKNEEYILLQESANQLLLESPKEQAVEEIVIEELE